MIDREYQRCSSRLGKSHDRTIARAILRNYANAGYRLLEKLYFNVDSLMCRYVRLFPKKNIPNRNSLQNFGHVFSDIFLPRQFSFRACNFARDHQCWLSSSIVYGTLRITNLRIYDTFACIIYPAAPRRKNAVLSDRGYRG